MCDDYCLPQEVGQHEDAQMQQATLRYLQQGDLFESCRGYSWCRFCCGAEPEQMGAREFTDGIWCWPEGLAHYIKDHNVRLPDEFYRSVMVGRQARKRKYNKNIDTLFWTEWCKSQRRSAIVEETQKLRKECSLQQAAQLEADSSNLEQERGLSGNICIMRGCTSPALTEVVYCAKHWLSRDDQLRSTSIDSIEHDLFVELIDMANNALQRTRKGRAAEL